MALEISRSDIPSDAIFEEHPGRFIKPSIAKYVELLKSKHFIDDPLPSQMAIVNALNNPKYRFVTAAISRRQGKTFIANIIGQLVILVPGCSILIMSPNYNLSQISFDMQRKLIAMFGLEVTRSNAKDRIIELANGSTIRMGSVSQADSCVGRSYDLIIFDEAALADGMDAFNVTLRPTLDKINSKALFISTPRGKKNWFHELFQRGFSDEFPAWASIRATYHDNPRSNPVDIAEAKSTMSDSEFRQEYMADFNTFEGQIWKFEKDYFNTTPEAANYLDLPKDCDFFGGLDIGFKDPTAMCVVGYSWSQDKFYIVDEYMAKAASTAEHAVEISKLVEKWNLDYLFIDAAAAQVKFDLAQLYDISCANAKKDVLAGIGYVSSLIENDRLEISVSCDEVVSSFNAYQWDPNDALIKEKPIHNMASHMADAIRYALYSFQTSCNIS